MNPAYLPAIAALAGSAIGGLTSLASTWLSQSRQNEVDATGFDIAAWVDGRVANIPVARGQNVAAGAVLVRVDNPETIAKNEQALAARFVSTVAATGPRENPTPTSPLRKPMFQHGASSPSDTAAAARCLN
jgi:multidrug resistance efflux pump